MPATYILHHPQISVIDYRCDAAVGDRPYAEQHDAHSIAYVRKGSFGYRSGSRSHELVAGSVLAGQSIMSTRKSRSSRRSGGACLPDAGVSLL